MTEPRKPKKGLITTLLRKSKKVMIDVSVKKDHGKTNDVLKPVEKT